eukprot:TRINITY_DN14067_c0_g1_i1.p1 TRINITY_DN14067_c0_g1~~TRINITY_DN14067_c0_g1_i1.p1  ORF type:complete len:269 (+),score=23.08 TRINITY_DN14067_c0_g1_i1:66-809(+)
MASMYQILRYKSLFSEKEAPVPSEDLPEVIHEWTFNPFYLFLMLLSKFIFWRRNQAYTPCHAIRLGQLNIGQQTDVLNHQRRLKDADSSGESLICFGVSRGAMTTFISLALNPPPKSVRLVILEGSPDSIPNVLQARYGNFFGRVAEILISAVTRYHMTRARTHSALALVDSFPKDLPVAFITAERDAAVPASNTLRLAEALKQTGHQKVHVLVLKHASHDSYITGHPDDRKRYVEFVNELRQKYQC